MSQAATWGVPLAADAPVSPGTMATRMDDAVDALLSSHSGAGLPAYAVNGTVWQDSDTGQLFLVTDDASSPVEVKQIAVNVGTPASASATGTAGDVAWDASYFYICTATDTWKRVAVATW